MPDSYRIQNLQERLGRNISEEEADQIRELLRVKAQEVGEALPESQTRELDTLLLMVQERYAIRSSDIEKLLSNIGTKEPKKENKTKLDYFLFASEATLAVISGAYVIATGTYLGIGFILNHNSKHNPNEIYTFNGEVISENSKKVGAILQEYSLKYSINGKPLILKYYGESSNADCLNDAISPGDDLQITTRRHLEVAIKYGTEQYYLDNNDILKLNGEPINCWF